MTATEVITNVRNLNNDDSADAAAQVWRDDKYILALNEGMRDIFDNHPESRITSAGALVAFAEADPNNPDTTLTFPSNMYKFPLIDFVLYRYYIAEGGDVRDNARAGFYLQRYQTFFKPMG